MSTDNESRKDCQDRAACIDVIVNWNGKKFLGDCLGSLQAQSFSDFEVVFVDNGSTDGSLEFVRENFPEIVIVESKENLGFAGGNNRGIEAARGDFILTLNNDTELEVDFLERLAEVAETSECGPRRYSQ